MQLQLITDNMNEVLIVIDKDANILSINSYAAKIFSLKEYEVKQKHYSVLTENSKFIDAVAKALKNNRTSLLIEISDADYRAFCSPVLKDGQLNGVVILLFDVTTILQSEKLRREFSANVSHELRTPLNGYAQLITNGIASPDDVPSFAAKIAKESNRLMLLIEDIIRLSKLDESEYDSFLTWLTDYEYNKLGVPKPDAVVYLCLPPEISQKMIQHRCDETGAEKDIHESNKAHLENSYKAALYSAEKLGWIKIDCDKNGEMRSREEIHKEIIEKLRDIIPELSL